MEEAALRETQEEIGLDMNLVNVLAFIGPFVDRVSTSHFTMHTSSYSLLIQNLMHAIKAQLNLHILR